MERTLSALQEGREEVSELARSGRAECRRVEQALQAVKRETLAVLDEVDRLEGEERKARLYLMQVNRDFHRYSEQEARRAYEEAQRLQVHLAEVRERERWLRRQRDELERSLRNLTAMAERAESLLSQVTAALELLAGNIERLSQQLQGLQERSEVGRRVLQAQEEERRRLARDIHDGPAQSMAHAVVRIELCERLLDLRPEEGRKEIGALKGTLKQALQELRQIIFDLRPMTLDELGLVPTLRRYLEGAAGQGGAGAGQGSAGAGQGSAGAGQGAPGGGPGASGSGAGATLNATSAPGPGPSVGLVVLGQPRRLAPEVEVAAFRLVQEAVSNARRHAGAQRVAVRVEFGAGAVVVAVDDDGSGFDVEAVRKAAASRGSLGLVSMEERVSLAGGELRIRSAPGQGTRVTARFPTA